MKSFPLPLTASEEQYYLQKYIEGDLNAKHILIEHNLRLVAHIVKKYQANVEEAEDLLSIGTIEQSLHLIREKTYVSELTLHAVLKMKF